MRAAFWLVLVPLLAGCASRLAGATNDELVKDLVEIRPWDGHAGFGTPDGPKSYGWEAKEILVERKAEAVPALVAALKDPKLDATQKSLVRIAIGELGGDARKAVPALVEDMKTADARTVVQICFALGRMGPAAQEAVPALLEILATRGDEVVTPTMTIGDYVHPASRLRTFVVAAFGGMGAAGDAALPVLAEGALRTDDVYYRQACRRAIRGILGPQPGYGSF